MKIIDRIKAPTPKFHKRLRNIGLGLIAAGGAILASPVVLPIAVGSLASYLIVAGSVATAVAQSVTADRK